MASIDINLLSLKKEQTSQEIRLRYFLSKATPIVSVAIIILGIVVFGADWYATSSLMRQSNEIDQYKTTIADNETQEGVYLSVLQKTTFLKKLLATRKPYAEFFTYLRTFAVDDTSVQSFELNDKNELLITLFMGSTDSIQRVISSIEEKGKSYFAEAELTNLIQVPGGYEVTFTFRNMKENKSVDNSDESNI